MLVSNIFLTAFYERSGFQPLGIVLSFVPVISVSETLAFAIGLRNLVFVTGDHLYRGSIISFLTMPVKRELLFLFVYVTDNFVPLAIWVLTEFLYSYLSGIGVPSLLLVTFVVGYFFSENLVFFLTLLFRSPGVSTLLAMFILGGVFVFGGAILYYQLLQGATTGLYALSFSNPFVLWIANSLGKDLVPEIVTGLLVDGILGTLFLLVDFMMFRRLEL
ncbi:hypothetical protein GWK48_02730 [Metallosphaera tengchongensis]|uniref:Uncharacterized protein n=2 Tax=Metallosphaera tengchongensis TaxID=1532350 RepID=A0A6N0NXI4_9CREN|nr:hypothetical protein GWK48_02730 [Metallosphaera tengchongensis]